MAKDRLSWFEFNPSEFLALVEDLSAEEVGAVTRLLCRCWMQSPVGTLPDNDHELARYARLAIDRWTAVRPGVIRLFSTTRDGRLQYQPFRLQYQEAKKRFERALDAANARWATDKTCESEQCSNDDLASLKHCNTGIGTGKGSQGSKNGEGVGGGQKKEGVGRKRNVIWDVMVELFYPSGITNKGRFTGEYKRFLALRTNPDEIRKRYFRCRQSWGHQMATCNGLLNNWDRFGPEWTPPGESVEGQSKRILYIPASWDDPLPAGVRVEDVDWATCPPEKRPHPLESAAKGVF